MNKIILTVLVSAVFCLAQEKPKTPAPIFTLEDVQVMANYYSKASIPARSDSLTLAAVQTLRNKLNAAIRTQNVKDFALTDKEKDIVVYMLGEDVPAARRVLSLNNKLFVKPVAARNDTVKALAKK